MSAHLLITGGAGRIGSLLAHQALASGMRVTVLDDLDPVGPVDEERRVPAELRKHPDATVVEGDVRDTSLLATVFAKGPFTAVVHLAGRNAFRCASDPLACHAIHVRGTLAVLEQSRAAGTPHVVLLAPAAAMPGAYGVIALAVERFAQVHAALHGMRITRVPVGEVYAPHPRLDGTIERLVGAVHAGGPVPPDIQALDPLLLSSAEDVAAHLLEVVGTPGEAGCHLSAGPKTGSWPVAALVAAVHGEGHALPEALRLSIARASAEHPPGLSVE